MANDDTIALSILADVSKDVGRGKSTTLEVDRVCRFGAEWGRPCGQPHTRVVVLLAEDAQTVAVIALCEPHARILRRAIAEATADARAGELN